MQTQQIIQASANVIRITKLVKGNIYKRFEDGSDRTYYGIVTDVLNDGINSIITATEYRKSWRDIEVEMKVIKGNKDVVLFPATIDELQMEFDSVIESKLKSIEEHEKAIVLDRKLIEVTRKLLSGELQKELSTPEFREMSQDEYNEKTRQLN